MIAKTIFRCVAWMMALLVLESTAGAMPGDGGPPVSEERPNILWIMSEDNSKHYLREFDEHGAPTPSISEMAAHGVVFERAFSNAPVCSVARTTLITSVHAPRLGTQFHRRIQLATLPDGWKMFPALLRDAGYYTTNQSKKDYNAVESEGTWDQSNAKADWRNRDPGQPFFHVQTFTDSHESSLHFDQAWVDNPDNVTNPATIQLAPYHPDTTLFRLTYARYLDRIGVIDRKVGNLIRQLADAGELENTFVFYFGDHGGVLPRGKGYVYESGLHVPLVVRVPNQWKDRCPFDLGARTNGFVEFVDFGPTVLALAGIQVPQYVDGKPFLGADVDREEVERRNTTIGYADRMDEKYDLCRSLRVGNLKYIRNFQAIYPDGLQNNYRYQMLAYQQWRQRFQDQQLNAVQAAFFQSKPPEQLFDLSQDPYETVNLANSPQHRSELVALRQQLTARLNAWPDLSFLPESYLVDEALADPIAFGSQHREPVVEYIEVANQAIADFPEALPKLAAAIQSTDRWKRYWGYSVCSILGQRAEKLLPIAKRAAAEDEEPLVRLRAVEFAGTLKAMDPLPVISSIISESDSPTLNLIALQTLVYFKEGPFKYPVELDLDTIHAFDAQTARRLGYLTNLKPEAVQRRLKGVNRVD